MGQRAITVSVTKIVLVSIVFAAISSLPVSAATGHFISTAGSFNMAYGLSSLQYGTGSTAGASHAFYLNFGGPALKFHCRDVAFGASLFPSLKMLEFAIPGVNTISTALGFGPFFTYEKLALSLPIYFPSVSTTDVAVGLGYTF